MKKQDAKFFRVPSFRKMAVGVSGLGAMVVGSAAFAEMAGPATAAIASAQADGESVGAAVVACVAALCVVGVIIALIRKV